MNPSQPVALVTGASSGIGETYARTLARKGYRLILVARRKEKLEKLAAEFGNAEILTADLSADPDIRKVEARIAAEPDLEFLVNNAGFGVPGYFWKADLEALDRMHHLHIIAIERLTHAALQGMTRRRKGYIVNVSSVAGFFNTLKGAGYCATKSWINRFTEGLYLELKHLRSPVRVQALCPGFTHTEFHDVIKMDRERIAKSLWMTAEEVVEDSLRGLERNRLIVIPGWRYRLFVRINCFLPQSLKHYIALKYVKR
jgi:uncharacterized protein